MTAPASQQPSLSFIEVRLLGMVSAIARGDAHSGDKVSIRVKRRLGDMLNIDLEVPHGVAVQIGDAVRASGELTPEGRVRCHPPVGEFFAVGRIRVEPTHPTPEGPQPSQTAVEAMTPPAVPGRPALPQPSSGGGGARVVPASGADLRGGSGVRPPPPPPPPRTLGARPHSDTRASHPNRPEQASQETASRQSSIPDRGSPKQASPHFRPEPDDIDRAIPF